MQTLEESNKTKKQQSIDFVIFYDKILTYLKKIEYKKLFYQDTMLWPKTLFSSQQYV